MAEEPVLLTDTREGVHWITLNRPEKRNALSGELVESLKTALAAADRHEEARVIAVRGAPCGGSRRLPFWRTSMM
jgi:enoyl-CoA hydratase/carnithine racemase